jgi:hypothetical protein
MIKKKKTKKKAPKQVDMGRVARLATEMLNQKIYEKRKKILKPVDDAFDLIINLYGNRQIVAALPCSENRDKMEMCQVQVKCFVSSFFRALSKSVEEEIEHEMTAQFELQMARLLAEPEKIIEET